MMVAHNPSVLVIETDDILANQLATDLQEAGYEAILAQDSVSGWQYYRDRQPALIIIDRMLVGESGLAFCKNLRNQGIVTPVLILMARDTIDDRVACLESGADDYIDRKSVV